jgi:hypothetical protein
VLILSSCRDCCARATSKGQGCKAQARRRSTFAERSGTGRSQKGDCMLFSLSCAMTLTLCNRTLLPPIIRLRLPSTRTLPRVRRRDGQTRLRETKSGRKRWTSWWLSGTSRRSGEIRTRRSLVCCLCGSVWRDADTSRYASGSGCIEVSRPGCRYGWHADTVQDIRRRTGRVPAEVGSRDYGAKLESAPAHSDCCKELGERASGVQPGWIVSSDRSARGISS